MGALGPSLGIGIGKLNRKNVVTAAQIKALFTYQIDWEANTQLPNLGTLMNNNNDGRLFREQSNVAATFCPDAAGVLQSIAATRPRFTTAGLYTYPNTTCSILQSRTLNNAVWVNDGITLTRANGPDGVTNSAWVLTATKAGASLKQSITNASAGRHAQADVKKGSTANYDFTVDGITWVPKIAPVNWDTFNPAFIYQAGVTNAVLGWRLANIGDSIIVDFPYAFGATANFEGIPCMSRPVTTTGGVNPGQCRQAALQTDLTPLVGLIRTRWSGYAEGSWVRPTGGFLFTGASNTFISVDPTNAVKFLVGSATAIAPVGAHQTGLRVRNKVAWTSRADGTIDIAVNGQLGTTGTGAVPDAAFDHGDLWTNGAGNNSNAGYNYKFMAMAAPLTRSQLAILTA